MTTTIDVAALYAIYAGPYTAPDGTTRRGLLERCPPALPRFVVQGCPPEVNAALCRVAVEDWLAEQSCGVKILDHTSGTAYDGEGEHLLTASCVVTWVGGGSLGLSGVAVDWRDDGSTADCVFNGLTLHHALVAAAHAVLDAQGVPA